MFNQTSDDTCIMTIIDRPIPANEYVCSMVSTRNAPDMVFSRDDLCAYTGKEILAMLTIETVVTSY